jgi:hypothetical protein
VDARANTHFMSLPYREQNISLPCNIFYAVQHFTMGVTVHPLVGFVVVFILGYVVARVVISSRPFMDFKQKQFVMVVRHSGKDFVEFAIAIGVVA